jgi:hypothetical protein
MVDVTISRLPRKPPSYTHRCHGLLFAQVKLIDGRWFSQPLDTRNNEVAAARMAPLLERLVREGKLKRTSRVCRLYLMGRCPKCGRPLPGVR